MYAASAALLVAALLAGAAGAGPGPDQAAGPAPLRAGPPEPPEVALHCPPDDRRCRYIGGGGGEHQYSVEDNKILVEHKPGSYFHVSCDAAHALESGAAPRAAAVLRVTDVVLTGCAPPAHGSLADLLAALNVSAALLGSLALKELPPAPALRAAHFAGLGHLRELRLDAGAAPGSRAAPAAGFLAPLAALEVLRLQRVTLPPDELDAPPPRLRSLHLAHAGVARVPPGLLAARELRTLAVVSERELDAVAVPPGLETLDLWSPATTLRLDAAPSLTSLVLSNWSEQAPLRLERCGNLTRLQLSSPAVRELPAGWLAACPRLERLELQYARNLTRLPKGLLANASELTVLSFKFCSLESLPEDLLDYTPRLLELHLIENHLRTLPSGMFARAGNLSTLDLSRNRLEGGLAELAPLRRLTDLRLRDNPRLPVRCDDKGNSPFKESKELQTLNLKNTSVSQICSDWRRDLTRLAMLQLQHTRVKELWFEDLQFTRSVKRAIVYLEHTPLTLVVLTRSDYNRAVLGSKSDVSVQLGRDNSLACDCYMYWTRRALAAPGRPLAHVSAMYCADGRALRDVPSQDMLCADDAYSHPCRGAAPPAACACASRPDDDPAFNRTRVRIDCTGRGLRHVPLPPPPTPERERLRYELLLQHNNISELPPAALRSDIVKLDLSSNVLKTVSEATATKLYNFTGILGLAENQLDCSCSAAPLLAALAWRRRSLGELAAAECEDGSNALDAPTEGCAPRNATWLAVALAVLFALSLGAVAFLWSRERRFFFKAVLHRWGLWWPAAAETDDDRPYDAFVTFSHKDEARVLELVARLEPPYRLCVHYRDWVPGRYITEQIAESVAGSRRTIALVSRHFLESGWALAEFRQAHAAAMLEARPRLVVVLLEDPAALRLDAQLRRYLATNTYVRWGDPWLWDKLALALPRPRAESAAFDAFAPDLHPKAATKAPKYKAATAKKAATVGKAETVSKAATAGKAAAASHHPPSPGAAAAANHAPSNPDSSSTACEFAVKRSPEDTRVTILTDIHRSSAMIPAKSTSSNEVELAPLCPAAADERETALVRDVKAEVRGASLAARVGPPPGEDLTLVSRQVLSRRRATPLAPVHRAEPSARARGPQRLIVAAT